MTTTQNNAGYTGYNLCNRACNHENIYNQYISENCIYIVLVHENVYGDIFYRLYVLINFVFLFMYKYK